MIKNYISDVSTNKARKTAQSENHEQLRAYTQIKLELAEQFRIIHELLETLGCKDDEQQLEELLVKLAEDRFTLAVVGQFKRGKSSIMNAIIGRKYKN
jgi:ribosome biogenesis GTPase A